MEWSNELPEKDGRYIVKTESTVLNTEYVMYAEIHTNEKGKRIWSFKNQLFKSYLKGKTKEEIIDKWVSEYIKAHPKTPESDFIELRADLNTMSIEILKKYFQIR